MDFIIDMKTNPKILFFDLEMTGGNTLYDDILQLSLVDLSTGLLFDEYFRPRKCKSWKDTEAIHHITPGMVKRCLSVDKHSAKIRNLLRDADVLVGFGIENDLKFMFKDKLSVGKNTVIYDLQKPFSRLYSSNNNMPSLQHCASYYRCPDLGVQHNSLVDSYMIAYCFIAMFNLPIPKWLEELYDKK